MGNSKEPTLAENFNQLKQLLIDSEGDIMKNFEKGNYSAGQRFRKTIKEVKTLLSTMRKQTLELKKEVK
jgi:hypothetical protein